MPKESINTMEPLSVYGLDSIAIAQLIQATSEHLNKNIDAMLVMEYSTIYELARAIVSGEGVKPLKICHLLIQPHYSQH